jgi:hypothetical protein
MELKVKKLLLGIALVALVGSLGSESARAYEASFCASPAIMGEFIRDTNNDPRQLQAGLAIVDIRGSHVVRAGARSVTCYAQLMWNTGTPNWMYWGVYYNVVNNEIWFHHPNDRGY